MKRIFSLFAAFVFAALVIASPAALAGGGPVVFSMNSVENVSPGESFAITLSVSGDYQAHGMHLSVEFDPNSMTLESCSQGDYLNAIRDAGAVVLLDAETLAPEGKIKLGVMMPMEPATGSGEVLIMNFHVNEGVTVNQQVIMVIREFIYMPLGQMAGTHIPFSTHNSIISLNGGATPEAGYNEGDDGIGNNNSSSPSQAPDPTPGSQSTPAPTPIVTPAPATANPDGSTPEPGSTAIPSGRTSAEPNATPAPPAETAQPGEVTTASPDGTVTASPENTAAASPDESGEPVDASEAPDGIENTTGKPDDPASEQKNREENAEKKASPVPYIVAGAAAVCAVAAGAIVFLKKKKRG